MRSSFILAAALFVSAPCFAGVRVGEISAPHRDAQTALRRAVEEEVAKLHVDKNAIVSVSLVRLETQTDRNSICVVSATLRSDNGVLFAILEGRAHAQGHAMESAALKSAVHGAISRIPDALH